EKMQSLCRGCHNAKTRGLLDYTRHPDGTTSVTSIDDGHTVTTVPTGPMAKAITTFDQSLARRVAARAEHEQARQAWKAITSMALTLARTCDGKRGVSETPF
ncbi:MAG TPA: HNH endonuclease, partial [Corynebacterium variabile]|nr:HNH endonuclease [Corynebacterium variabile]